MDPITALALATNVVSLVDVSWRVVSKSREIYKNGALPEHSEEDEGLRTLCLSCNKIAGELVARLDLLKVGDRNRNWKSIRQALKSVWIKSTLDEIAARLQAYRFQLNTRILLSLRYGLAFQNITFAQFHP